MGVIMQAAYRQAVGLSVPAPVDAETPNVDWWYDHIAKQVHSWRKVGFTAVLLPPVLKAQGGSGKGCDGYAVYDDYDFGQKDQQGSIPTRFGYDYQLRRMIAIAKANGLDIYLDMVPHQRMGGNRYVYRYAPNGQGRFPKDPGCFNGHNADGSLYPGCVPHDPVAGPMADDTGVYAFGDALCPVNAVPKNYVMNGLVNAWTWLSHTLGIDGARNDDTKGQAIITAKTLASTAMYGKFIFGEYADGNPVNLYQWLQEVSWWYSCFDFSTHYILESMCNNHNNFYMPQLDHAGLLGVAPLNAVTFVESPDTDTDGFASIIWNKLLGYAYILTNEGYPMVYYRDYSPDPGCYGLKPWIDNLIWIHENFANGPTVYRHKEYQAVVYERISNSGLLVGLNNDQYNWHTVYNIQTSHPNTRWHDYSGNNTIDCYSDANGVIAVFGIPPNNNGLGYVCWAPFMTGNAPIVTKKTITQVFYGDNDLLPGAATYDGVDAGKIWCDEHTIISMLFIHGLGLGVTVIGPDGKEILPVVNKFEYITTAIGFYTIKVYAAKEAVTPFELAVTYTSTLNFVVGVYMENNEIDKVVIELNHSDVAVAAYYIWLNTDPTDDSPQTAVHNWLEAETNLLSTLCEVEGV